MINNKYGIEKIGHGENVKKRNTKVTIVCDHEKKNVYSVHFAKGNTSDVHTVEPLMDSILKKIKPKKINLVGDKGYIVRDEVKKRLSAKK